VAYLQQEGVDGIDVIVVAHPYEDHIDSPINILQPATPVESVVCGRPGTTVTHSDFVTAMQADGLTATAVAEGQDFTWGRMAVSALNPQIRPEGDTNEDSVVLLMTYGEHEFLFTGDIGANAEVDILASGILVDADVLRVAHDGSKYSSGQAFLNRATPAYAVISLGEDNTYGHPVQEMLGRPQIVRKCYRHRCVPIGVKTGSSVRFII